MLENVEDCLFPRALANTKPVCTVQVGVVVAPRKSEEGGWRAW